MIILYTAILIALLTITVILLLNILNKESKIPFQIEMIIFALFFLFSLIMFSITTNKVNKYIENRNYVDSIAIEIDTTIIN